MEKQSHTPEPWAAGHYSSVVGLPITAQPDKAHNTIVLAGLRGDRETAEANARRIVACVNACTGIPTEALEAGDLRDLLACPRDDVGRLLRLLGKLRGEE